MSYLLILLASVATFENFASGINVAKTDTVWQGADTPSEGVNTWTSGDYQFATYADMTYGSYFYAFTVSSETASTSTGWLEPYRSAAGGAYEGQNFCVWYTDYYGNNAISVSQAQVVPGTFVNNNAYTVNSMVNGDDMATPFTNEDWLVVYFIGQKEGQVTDTVSCYLAKDGKYIDQWTWIDLSGIGEVDQVTISMAGSKVGDWGLNTPAYVCLDNFGAAKPSDTYVAPEMKNFQGTGWKNLNQDAEVMRARKVLRNHLIVIEYNGKTILL